MTTLWVLVWVVAVTGGVRGYSRGAPSRACGNMQPVHGRTGAQTSPTLYSISFPGGQTSYIPGRALQVRLAEAEGKSFRGFLIKARNATSATPIGRFTYQRYTKSVCKNGRAGALTHSSWRVRKELLVTWIAPTDLVGDIYFVATVVQRMTTYWMNITSPVLSQTLPSTIATTTLEPITPEPTTPRARGHVFTPPAPNATISCREESLQRLPEVRPHVTILCTAHAHCPCGWVCCPLCDAHFCANYAVCRQPRINYANEVGKNVTEAVTEAVTGAVTESVTTKPKHMQIHEGIAKN